MIKYFMKNRPAQAGKRSEPAQRREEAPGRGHSAIKELHIKENA
jgi:hypothetical protein